MGRMNHHRTTSSSSQACRSLLRAFSAIVNVRCSRVKRTGCSDGWARAEMTIWVLRTDGPTSVVSLGLREADRE